VGCCKEKKKNKKKKMKKKKKKKKNGFFGRMGWFSFKGNGRSKKSKGIMKLIN
jgi:hypothetical protein